MPHTDAGSGNEKPPTGRHQARVSPPRPDSLGLPNLRLVTEKHVGQFVTHDRCTAGGRRGSRTHDVVRRRRADPQPRRAGRIKRVVHDAQRASAMARDRVDETVDVAAGGKESLPELDDGGPLPTEWTTALDPQLHQLPQGLRVAGFDRGY